MAVVDAILSYHTSAVTCGTAKFNRQLAQRLGVPFGQVGIDRARYQCPLVSVRFNEIAQDTHRQFNDFPPADVFDLFVHDADDWHLFQRWLSRARTVYAANVAIARRLGTIRPDVITVACPSTIQGNPTHGSINVLTFGMAHKIQTTHYERLRALLDASGADYTVSVSTAIHEGSPWDETVRVADRLRALFGSRLRVLGYLADDALSREIRDCTAAAIFYDPAFRSNNTSGWAVVEAGKPFITNWDHDSPNVGLDIQQMTEWPIDFWHDSKNLGQAPTWDGLLAQLTTVHA